MSLADYIDKELRSDHAGEVGAVQIYRGIKAVALLRGDIELMRFADAHGAVEQQHLNMMEKLVPAEQRSRLQVPWQIAGWLTGAVPALFGRDTVYATIQAVETFVDQHYQQQIDQLSSHPEHADLTATLAQFQADEVHHRDDAASRIESTNPALKLWGCLIGIGSKAAVSVCRKI
jgi:ubiquinone biosynthesis monooxygenase Coq7